MQQDVIQQEEQTCILHEDRQTFIEEILALRYLAAEAGVTGYLLAELDDFKHHVERLDASAWERKEVRNLSRNEFVTLCLAVLRAYSSRSCGVE